VYQNFYSGTFVRTGILVNWN